MSEGRISSGLAILTVRTRVTAQSDSRTSDANEVGNLLQSFDRKGPLDELACSTAAATGGADRPMSTRSTSSAAATRLK
jgi:hypothetical protein